MTQYTELKSSGITAKTPENIMLGAGTIHKGFHFGYYEECESTEENALEVVADTATPTSTQIKVSDVKPVYTTVEAGDYVKHIDKWNFSQSLLGATSGGSKLSIVPEITDIEVDGKLVKVKGLDVKTGETAKIETNMVEITPEWMKMAVIGQEGTSTITGFNVIESKAQIEDGDYITDFAYVGKKTDGTPIIVIFDYCLCTTGLEVEGKNKEAGVFAATFECYAEISPEADKLPYHIYYPTPTV